MRLHFGYAKVRYRALAKTTPRISASAGFLESAHRPPLRDGVKRGTIAPVFRPNGGKRDGSACPPPCGDRKPGLIRPSLEAALAHDAQMRKTGAVLLRARQCGLLGVWRSSQYYAPAGESAENLALMRRLDELHLEHPLYGNRQMARHLRREGVVAGRHRVRRLMRLLGIEAICHRPRTSAANRSAGTRTCCATS